MLNLFDNMCFRVEGLNFYFSADGKSLFCYQLFAFLLHLVCRCVSKMIKTTDFFVKKCDLFVFIAKTRNFASCFS